MGLVAYGTLYDETRYTTIGQSYADQLFNQGLGLDPERRHFTLNYPGTDAGESYILTYNLYPDKLLGLDTFPANASAMQAAFYPSVHAEAGTPLTSKVTYGKTDWSILAGAVSPGAG